MDKPSAWDEAPIADAEASKVMGQHDVKPLIHYDYLFIE